MTEDLRQQIIDILGRKFPSSPCSSTQMQVYTATEEIINLIIPGGWKIVPREPTKEMIEVGFKQFASNQNTTVWRVMYDAAPTKLADHNPDSCECPTHGKWYAADDIDRMVKELDWAMNGEDGAQRPRLCDIFHQLKDLVTPDPLCGEYVNDPPYKEMRLRIALTGTASPDEQQWSAALDQLSDHLEKFPIPTEPLVDIEVDLPDDLLLVSAMAAHRRGITLNQYINDALKALLDSLDAK